MSFFEFFFFQKGISVKTFNRDHNEYHRVVRLVSIKYLYTRSFAWISFRIERKIADLTIVTLENYSLTRDTGNTNRL